MGGYLRKFMTLMAIGLATHTGQSTDMREATTGATSRHSELVMIRASWLSSVSRAEPTP